MDETVFFCRYRKQEPPFDPFAPKKNGMKIKLTGQCCKMMEKKKELMSFGPVALEKCMFVI